MELRSFLISKERSGREEKIEEVTPDVLSIEQPKTSLKSGLLFSKVASQFLVLFVLAVGFLQVSFISYSQKHDSQNATDLNSFQPVTLNFKYGTPHTEVVYTLQTRIISCPRSKRNTYLPAPPAIFFPNDQNKLCAHDKNRKRAELCVEISFKFNVFAMYALDSAHKKVQRMKRSRSFAVVFDKPGRIERQVDPNTNLPNPIDLNVELYMCRI